MVRARIVLLTALLFTLSTWASDRQASLDERLTQIEKVARSGGGLDKVEAEALKLTREYPSPKDVGKVYAHIAFLYAERPAEYQQTAKVIAYATMALNYPLDLQDRAKVYLDWGSAVISKYWTADQYLQHRREAVVPLLTGLKLLLDDRVPETTVELPGVGKYDLEPSDPEYQEIVRKHQLQEEARKRAMALNELVEIRIALTGTISSLYSFGIDATQELKEISSQILRNDAAVAALLAKTKEERATHIRKKISTLYQGQISCL